MKIDGRKKHNKDLILARLETEWTIPDIQEEFGFLSYRACQKYLTRLLDALDLDDGIRLRDKFKRLPRGRK